MQMNPDLVNWCLRIAAAVFIGLGHSPAIPQPWAQIIGEVGAALLLLTKTKPGDIPIKSLPPEVQETLRPPAK